MMTSKEKTMALRWSLLSAGLIALFWTIWYLITGDVPEVTSLDLWASIEIELPFAISRWWDVLLGPIYTLTAIFIWLQRESLGILLILLAAYTVFGILVGLITGLIYGLTLALFILIFPISPIVGRLIGTMSQAAWRWLTAEDKD